MSSHHGVLLALFLSTMLMNTIPLTNAQSSSSSQSLTGYQREYTPDFDLSSSNTIVQATWPTSGTNLQNCASTCSALQANCTVFSLTVNNQTGNTICKAGRNANGTVTNAGSVLYYKYKVDNDGFSTYLDPFRYKLIYSPVTSATDASEICESMNALLPVAYPSQKAFDTLRSFMPQNGAIVLGVTLTGIDNATGIQSFVTYRGWNFKANASDPMQHWLPGEPKLHQDYDDVSDIGVMMTPDGWFTVNTRKGDVLTSNVICIRHSVYELLAIGSIRKYFKFYSTYKNTYNASASFCRSQEAHIGTFLGDEGIAMLTYFDLKGIEFFWIDGYKSTVTGLWEFSDGTFMDASVVAMRWIDTRQIWPSTAYPVATASHRCLRESDRTFVNDDCMQSLAVLCQGDF